MPATGILSADTGGPPADSRSPRPARKRFRRPRDLLGVDIGSSLIKVVLLAHRQGQVTLKQAILGATPSAVVTAGEMTDAIRVAESLRKLCKDHRLSTRNLAVAVSGEKVYTQFEPLPTELEEDRSVFVKTAIGKVVPYSTDSAVFDYELMGGKPAPGEGVFWVSSGREQVEWAREVVTLAGRVPAVVDVQACALVNAYTFNYPAQREHAVVLVHIGPRQMTIALVLGSVLLCSRDVTFSRSHPAMEAGALPALAVRELDRHWDLLLRRAAPVEPEQIYLSGGPSHSAELREALHRATGLPVEALNPFQTITQSSTSEAGRIAQEHGATLTVAVGLALRGFEEL